MSFFLYYKLADLITWSNYSRVILVPEFSIGGMKIVSIMDKSGHGETWKEILFCFFRWKNSRLIKKGLFS